jgi:hypothetical protein
MKFIRTLFGFLNDDANIQHIVKQYFDAFNKHDLDALSALYSESVVLSEWDENVFIGKDKVLAANKQLFDNEPNLYISVIATGTANNTSVNEIIVYTKTGPVKIVDSINVGNGKIIKVMAYRGF